MEECEEGIALIRTRPQPRPHPIRAKTAAAAGSKALRLTVCLAVISEVAGWHPRTPLTPRTAQWTTRMQSIFAEKGQHSVYEINPALDEINVSTCHFPKHGPPREKVFSPKWEQDRYRNYKHRPNTPMRHVLKPPTAPRGLIISWTLPEGMDFAYNATVFWQAPASTGQSNITHYVISRDNGLSWTEVKGGGAINQTVLTGLRRQAHVHVHLRAVNAVGTGPPAYASAMNSVGVNHKQLRELQKSSNMQVLGKGRVAQFPSSDSFHQIPLPRVKPRTKPVSLRRDVPAHAVTA